MALGKRTNENLNFLILKVKSKDADGKQVPPYFQVTKKVDGNWVVQEEEPTNVSGQIVKVEKAVTKFNNEEIPRINLYLRDGEDLYLLELRYTMLSRSILNSLLSLEDISKTVEISLYVNKKSYASVFVQAGGKPLSWKFSLDEQPKPEVVKFKGKEQRDFTAVDNFFEKETLEWANILLQPAGVASEGDSDDSNSDSSDDGKSSLF
jgi:hypothetical protein